MIEEDIWTFWLISFHFVASLKQSSLYQKYIKNVPNDDDDDGDDFAVKKIGCEHIKSDTQSLWYARVTWNQINCSRSLCSSSILIGWRCPMAESKMFESQSHYSVESYPTRLFVSYRLLEVWYSSLGDGWCMICLRLSYSKYHIIFGANYYEKWAVRPSQIKWYHTNDCVWGKRTNERLKQQFSIQH